MSLHSKSKFQTINQSETQIEVPNSYPPFLCPGRKFTQQLRTSEERNMIPFCCSEISPLREPQTKEEKDLVWFTCVMTNLDSIPSTGPLPSELSYILNNNIQLIKCEQWISDKLSSMRYFMPHPNRLDAYAEISKDAVFESRKDKKGRWISFVGWPCLKADCQYHPEEGLWICMFLRREEEFKAKEALTVKRSSELNGISEQRNVK
jgi:hypothetical protein